MQYTADNTSDVMLNISGSRELFGQDDSIELTVAGELQHSDGAYMLSYSDERYTGDTSHTDITVKDGSVFLVRTGDDESEMVLEKDKPFASEYRTPFGKLNMLVLPTMVEADMHPDKGHIELEYIMDIAGSQILNKLSLSYKKEKQPERELFT